MNFTSGQIFTEAIIISSLIIIIFSCFHYQKSPSPILFEKNDVFLSEEKDSREVIFEIVRIREIIKKTVFKLSFFLVIVIALGIFLAFRLVIKIFLEVDVFSLLIEFFNSVVKYTVGFFQMFIMIMLFAKGEKLEAGG